MKNSEHPAFPFNYIDESIGRMDWPGISKREYFAAMAMQGIASSMTGHLKQEQDTEKFIAKVSVKYADALLAELEKPKQ